jgi:hypothetical protein
LAIREFREHKMLWMTFEGLASFALLITICRLIYFQYLRREGAQDNIP